MKHFCKCGARLTDIVELMHYVCPDCYKPEEEANMISVKTDKGYTVCYKGENPAYVIKQDDSSLQDFLVYKIVEQQLSGAFTVRLLPKLTKQETAADFGHETLEAAIEWVSKRHYIL